MKQLANRVWAKKAYLALAAFLVMFAFVSYTSLSSISLLQGNARVVNYVGIVRGATQKLIKEELMGWHLAQTDPQAIDAAQWYPDDELIARLDGIIHELLTGEGENDLVVLQDDEYLNNMRQVRTHWKALKGLIMEVRAGADPTGMFLSSQEYFTLVNETVFSAERYSERQVARINTTLVAVNIIFVLFIVAGLVMYMRSLAVKRRAETLGKIAYVDPLTGLDNRASCERIVKRLIETPDDTALAVFMFDMNDLKLTNDFLGHKGGDIIIAEFAAALKAAGTKYGFIGRFGGDEFLGIFEGADTSIAEAFLEEVRQRVDEYNQGQPNALEQIKYAAGYVLANARETNIEDMIHEADNQMYRDKRRLKAI